MNLPNRQVPDLAQLGQVQVRDTRLIRVGALDLHEGGLSTGDAIAHAQIVDIPTATCWLLPLNTRALRILVEQAQLLLAPLDNGDQAA